MGRDRWGDPGDDHKETLCSGDTHARTAAMVLGQEHLGLSVWLICCTHACGRTPQPGRPCQISTQYACMKLTQT